MSDSASPAPTALASLVPAWLDWAECAEELGVSVSRVRQWVREHQLAQVVPVPGEGPRIPAELLMEGQVVKGVPGVLTVRVTPTKVLAYRDIAD